MKRICLVFLILLIGILAFAEDNVFMVYGNDFSIGVQLPNDWTVDMDFAQSQGISGFFYPKEFTLNNTPTAIILTLAQIPNKGTKLDDYIDYDMNILRSNYASQYDFRKLAISQIQKNNYRYVIYEMKTKTGSGHYQLIGYIDCASKYYVKIYIDCKTEEAYLKYSSIFSESVNKLTYMNIILKK